MLIAKLTHSIIHSYIVIFTCLNVVDVKVPLKRGALFAIIYGPLVIVARHIYNYVNVPFGTHSIILLMLMIILIKFTVTNCSYIQAVAATLIAYIIMLLIDTFITVHFLNLLNASVEVLNSSILVFSAVVIFQDLGFILLYILHKKLGFTIKI